MLRRRVNALAATGAVFAVLLLAGCGAGQASDPRADDGGATAADDTAADASGDDAAEEPAAEASGAVLPGTGRYLIGSDAPYGGYQLEGEPDAQPAGCTWSIQDADGAVVAENQGIYAFLTDVPEYVAFVTDGCPDWQQFE